MIRDKRLYNVISLLIFSFIFLIEKRIYGVPSTVFLLFLFFFSSRFFSYNHLSSSFNSISKIKGLILILLGLSIFTYIINYVNVETIINNYFYNTGEKPNFLYLKISLNGIIFLVLAYFSFSLGSSVNGDLKLINKIINLVINLTFILAIANVYTWAISTGGVVDRYNFNPLFISSYGINIQWSILGFILLLSKIDNFSLYSFKTIKLVLFSLSILIIISRLYQISFILSLLLYYYYTAGKFAKIKLFFYTQITIVTTFFLLPLFNFNFLNSYKLLSNIEGDDIQTRLLTVSSSLDIFYEYLLMGVGYGMFAGYNVSTIIVERTEVHLGSIHNGFISILAETGLVGLLIHILIIYYILKGVFKLENYKMDIRQYKFTVSVKVFLLFNIIFLFVSNYIFFPPPAEYSYIGISLITWMLMGMLFSFKEVKN